ncbi:MAG: helix-turn-helix transcriptional regulator [Capsulimonadaceae bacterium]|nr:helix-turn-helix transcriptional regulator [Capsulimonadaceae bacterium]
MHKSVHTEAQRELQALLRELREEAEYTQRDLAARLGVPQSRVGDYERGESLMDVLVLRQYATALTMFFSSKANPTRSWPTSSAYPP